MKDFVFLLFCMITMECYITKTYAFQLFDDNAVVYNSQSLICEINRSKEGSNSHVKKQEFRFSDGSIGYFVSDDGVYAGVVDATNKIIVPQKFRKIIIYESTTKSSV